MLNSERLLRGMDAQGLSQAELARHVGVSQQTIGKLANGQSTGSRYIHRISRALHMSPAYLMGETDDPDSEFPDTPLMSHEEIEMLDLLRGLRPDDRKAILQLARTIATSAHRGAVHAPGTAYRAEG